MSSRSAARRPSSPPPPPPYLRACRVLLDAARDRHASLAALIPPALWMLDAALCVLILWKASYTEIDWRAYMQQVAQYIAGERDYTKIHGATGPLVYPAAHVYIYTGLYYLTDRGKDILLAQQLFAVLYLATLAVVMLCYWQAKVPPYVFPLLIFSKRLHSIFVLRCFNDCFAVLFLWLAIYFLQRRHWTFGSVFHSFGLGVKMSLLLGLPAVAVVLFLGRGFKGTLRLASLMAQVQLVLALPFLSRNWKGYVGRAFELSRQFKYEWTVNWRMMSEELFLSKEFSMTLLISHLSVLVLFLTCRWMQPADRPVSGIILALLRGKSPFTQAEERRISNHISAEYVMTTILLANVIGLLAARSLHYQFYAYLAWTTPYLVSKASPYPWLVFPVWIAQEWAWNVFPSTDLSSYLVVGILILTLAVVWFGTRAVDDHLIVERKASQATNR